MKTIYLASGNAHKLHELQTALEEAGLPISVKGPAEIGGMPEVEETGSTFEANSLLKAQGLRPACPPDGWFLADDSGIEIDALDWPSRRDIGSAMPDPIVTMRQIMIRCLRK